MWSYLSTFLLSLLVALLMTPLVRRHAIRWGVVDRPGGRRIHEVPIPRLGGVSIAVAMVVTTAALFLYSLVRENLLHRGPNVFAKALLYNFDTVLGLGLGAAIILALGIYDDVKGARPLIKLGVQLGVALFCFHLGFRVQVIGLPWSNEPFRLGLLSLPFTVLWMVVIINAINLIDGIDGLASGASFFACVTMFILSYKANDLVSAFVLASLGGSILGFLFFNSNPAMVFLGDSGSLLLGFILAAVSVRGSTKGATAFSILVSAMALGLPLLDTSLAVVRRMLTGKPLMGADQDHIHHRLLRRGLSQRQVVLALYGLSAFLAVLALATSFLHGHKVFLTIMFIALAGILLVTMRYLGYVQHIKEARKNLFLHDLFAGMASRTDALLQFRSRLSRADSLDAVWSALDALRAPFAFHGIRLEIFPQAPGEKPLVWSSTSDQQGDVDRNAARLDVTLAPGGVPRGRLSIFWWQNGGESHPELYRLYFEVIKRELELAFAANRTLSAAPKGRLPGAQGQGTHGGGAEA